MAFSGLQHGGFWAVLPSWLRSWVDRSYSPTLRLFICIRQSRSSPLSLQFHHVPLYLEWAPVGVFSSSAPQKEEPQDTAVDRADKDRAKPETGESCVGSGCPRTGSREGRVSNPNIYEVESPLFALETRGSHTLGFCRHVKHS